MGETILTMAVLSIAISAPLGAILIMALGPVLLPNDFEGEDGVAGVKEVAKEHMTEVKHH